MASDEDCRSTEKELIVEMSERFRAVVRRHCRFLGRDAVLGPDTQPSLPGANSPAGSTPKVLVES